MSTNVDDFVIIARRERRQVRSCGDDQRYAMVTITITIFAVRPSAYRPRRGERIVADPPEAVLLRARNIARF